jgi:hypothetical protein
MIDVWRKQQFNSRAINSFNMIVSFLKENREIHCFICSVATQISAFWKPLNHGKCIYEQSMQCKGYNSIPKPIQWKCLKL